MIGAERTIGNLRLYVVSKAEAFLQATRISQRFIVILLLRYKFSIQLISEVFQIQELKQMFKEFIGVLFFSTLILYLQSPKPSFAAQQFCQNTSGNIAIVNPGPCPAITKRWARTSVFRKLKRACKLPRGSTVNQLKVTMKLLNYSKNKPGQQKFCSANWRVCTTCQLN